jgi:hypothetical protein
MPILLRQAFAVRLVGILLLASIATHFVCLAICRSKPVVFGCDFACAGFSAFRPLARGVPSLSTCLSFYCHALSAPTASPNRCATSPWHLEPTCRAACWPAPSAKQSLNLLAGFAFHPAGKCDHANGAGGGRFCLSQKPHVRNDLG